MIAIIISSAACTRTLLCRLLKAVRHLTTAVGKLIALLRSAKCQATCNTVWQLCGKQHCVNSSTLAALQNNGTFAQDGFLSLLLSLCRARNAYALSPAEAGCLRRFVAGWSQGADQMEPESTHT